MKDSIKGYIFDFNGTLLWDSALHEEAWSRMALKYIGRKLDKPEMSENMHGRTNDNILAWLLGSRPDDKTIAAMADEKEEIYRQLCLSLGDKLSLAPGAVPLLDILKKDDVPRAIATSSSIDNLSFYHRIFHLEQWFEEDCIIYDNGTFPGKPAPDIYLQAFKSLNLNPSECAVVEDSVPGVESAIAAKAGKVIVINEMGDFNSLRNIQGISRKIRTFFEIRI